MLSLLPRKLLLVLFVGFLCLSQHASAQNDASTPTEIQPSLQDDGSKRTDADQDDPNSRLQWERETWGTVTATFRQNAIKEGKKHGDRKHLAGPQWISIGPVGA
jgi:hypothetical protein